jgi:hypothetical protein
MVTIGLYLGDNRQFSRADPIPQDRSRFFAQIDFETGEGFIRVNETISADGQHFPPWPVVFNPDPVPMSDQQNKDHRHAEGGPSNRFRLSRSLDGSGIRLSWSLVHGDRRAFAGPLPTALQRPAFDGSLTVRRLSETSLKVTYDCDCFPNIEAQLLPPGGGRIGLIEVPNKGAEYGFPIYPACKVEEIRSVP